ncbi:MAG: hypothetical protein KME64_42810 [Scytonematopsis contorta HA4267-MV1]|jgi:hypothetical protein|nr:hypothetical protein [Scytonematopsis contorta HA4267-MV1]
MFDLLFDCSAFDIPATTQAINSVLFPVFLFFSIFWMFYQFFQAEAKFPNTSSICDFVELASLKPKDLVSQKTLPKQNKQAELYNTTLIQKLTN